MLLSRIQLSRVSFCLLTDTERELLWETNWRHIYLQAMMIWIGNCARSADYTLVQFWRACIAVILQNLNLTLIQLLNPFVLESSLPMKQTASYLSVIQLDAEGPCFLTKSESQRCTISIDYQVHTLHKWLTENEMHVPASEAGCMLAPHADVHHRVLNTQRICVHMGTKWAH